MKRIYIIEDDQALNHGIELALAKENYEFNSFYKLGDVTAIEMADLIILDLNLPDGNGLELLKIIRKTSDVPVLILTANDTELDEVSGLSMGADDYITKPFSLMVLRLRVEKLLNRSRGTKVYDKNGLYLDFDKLIFKRDELELDLSKNEIRLLKILVKNEGIKLSRDRLIEYVWQDSQYVDENALTVSIKRLRDKIEKPGERIIHTVYGIGYMFKWE